MNIEALTIDQVERLRSQPSGTKGRSISITEKDVRRVHDKLERLYEGTVRLSFAEKIAFRLAAENGEVW